MVLLVRVGQYFNNIMKTVIIAIAIIVSHDFGLAIISHYVFLTYDYFIHKALSTVNYV